METDKKKTIDLSKLPPKEELKELAKICKKLTEIIDNQTGLKEEDQTEVDEEENKKNKKI